MNTKRFLSSALTVLAFCAVASAQQRLDIVLKDRSTASISLDDINFMEIVEAAGENQIDGVWYLGWKYTSSYADQNGDEMIVFTKDRLRWSKKTGETIYDITYADEGPVPGTFIKAKKEGSTTTTNFKIYANDGEVLVLSQTTPSTARYYFYKTLELAKNATSPQNLSYLQRQQYATGAQVWNANIKGGSSHSNSTPMGRHFESFRAATADDIAWLADPNNQPDQEWHELGGMTWTAKTINLYPMTSSPTPADVNQHSIGDCCMCAVFASFAYIYPDWIKTIIEKNGNNYTVHMFDPKGNPVDVVVDNKILCNSNGSVAQVFGKNNRYNWATIMEKALMKWETCFRCNKIGGIGTEHAAPPFTGNGDSYSFDWGDRLYNAEYAMIVDYAIDNGMISVGGFHESGVIMGELESVTGHAFTVMKPDEDADYLFVMRNPWGNEPSGSTASNRTDGKLKIPNDHEKLRLIDFRLVYPGAQMAQYKKEDMGGYTPPRFNATYFDMNPTEDMLRIYNVNNYVPVFPMADDAFDEEFEKE